MGFVECEPFTIGNVLAVLQTFFVGLWWFSVGICKYKPGYTLRYLLKIQVLSLVEILFVNENPLQDFLSSLNAIISTNESTEFIAGHVIYKPAHTYKNQLKTTFVTVKSTGIPSVHFAGIQQF